MMGIENLTYEQEMERRRKIAEGQLEHGCRVATRGTAEFRTYTIWAAMKQRCDNPRSKSYHRYGGRGITVCPEWYRFENFLLDMGLAPKGYSIERDDNDKGYSKSNCRWATRREQASNRRTSRILVVGGNRMTLIELSRKTGIAHSTLRQRLERTGGVVDETVTRPVNALK